MTEKEERILVARSTDYTITDTDKGAKFDAKIEPNCAYVFSRQEAIEKIAKAICREDNCLDSCEECVLGFGVTAKEKEQFCQKQIIMSRDLSASYVCRAEAALNALLEETK